MTFELVSNEKNVARVKLTIPKEDFDRAIVKVYNRNKSRFNIPGFRKGKAPLAIIEQRYGKGVFYEDAIDECFPAAYGDCLKEGEFDAVASPSLVEINEVGENGAVLTVDIPLHPEFELAEYKGIKVGPLKYTFKKSDLDARIKEMQEKDVRLETLDDTRSKKDDTVIIDFEGFVDGEAFEGGKAEDYSLVLGSNTFIPGFEDQLVGKKAGQKVDVKVTFPEEYHAENLKGKEALFKCEVKAVQRKIYPEVDDEFAIDLGYENLEDMKAHLKDEIKESKTQELRDGAANKIFEELLDKTEIDLPAAYVEERARALKEDNDAQIQSRGIDPGTYYKFMALQSGIEDEEQANEMFMNVFRRQADRDLRTELIVEEILKKEEMPVSDEEFDKECEVYASRMGQTVEEFKKECEEKDYVKEYVLTGIRRAKLIDYLLSVADTSKEDKKAKEEAAE
ncbi:MAG: trigger factor [Eubacteriaceae bacterium]|nr:trigger factor [Eubacteriaceae bacterium]